MMDALSILGGFVILFLIYAILTFNKLVDLRTRVSQAWSEVDVLLKRKYNLIPSLVETVRGYAAHEQQVMEQIAQLRSQAMLSNQPTDVGTLDNSINEHLAHIFVVAEQYPQLAASVNFIDLQDQIVETEDTISEARRFYNGVVSEFNIAVDSFPSTIVALIFRMGRRQYFQLDQDQGTEFSP